MEEECLRTDEAAVEVAEPHAAALNILTVSVASQEDPTTETVGSGAELAAVLIQHMGADMTQGAEVKQGTQLA